MILLARSLEYVNCFTHATLIALTLSTRGRCFSAKSTKRNFLICSSSVSVANLARRANLFSFFAGRSASLRSLSSYTYLILPRRVRAIFFTAPTSRMFPEMRFREIITSRNGPQPSGTPPPREILLSFRLRRSPPRSLRLALSS